MQENEKKKYIIVGVIEILLILLAYRCDMIYIPSRLIYVGQVKINHDATPLGYDRGFDYLNKEDLERELNWLSELESGYFVLNQQEIDKIVDAANQYEGYPTVILSRVKSGVFWTRYRSPHIGYMDIHQIIGDGKRRSDDVLYVYVTKCTEIDDEPWMWEFRNRDWIN